MRKSLLFAGIACVALGGLVLGGKIMRERSTEVVDLGVLRAEATVRETYPQWLGYVALGAGVVLIIAGARARVAGGGSG